LLSSACVDVLQLFQLRERDVRLTNISAEDITKAVSELSLAAQNKVISLSMIINEILWHFKNFLEIQQCDGGEF